MGLVSGPCAPQFRLNAPRARQNKQVGLQATGVQPEEVPESSGELGGTLRFPPCGPRIARSGAAAFYGSGPTRQRAVIGGQWRSWRLGKVVNKARWQRWTPRPNVHWQQPVWLTELVFHAFFEHHPD